MLLHCFLEEFQYSLLVSALGDEAFQDLAFVIYSAPEVVPLTIDLHEDLVEMPTPATRFHTPDPAFPDLGGKHRSEAMPPVPDGFVADVDAALMQQILDVSQRERETHVQHHRQADHLFARIEVFERITFLHLGTLPSPPRPQQAKLL